MRRSIIALALLIILSVTVICAAAINVDSERDKVVITPDHFFGEEHVDGLQVRTRNTLGRYLLWETTYNIENDPDTDYSFYNNKYMTDYDFYRERYNEKNEREYEGIVVNANIEYGCDFDRDAEDQYGLARAYKELYDQVLPGEEKKKEILVKDYYEFYPIGAEINLPHYTLGWFGPLDYSSIVPEPSWDEYVYKRLEEYFRIPVIDEETLEISISKSSRGDGVGIGSGNNKDTDAFRMFSESAVADDACYFTFDAHTDKGEIVDLSYLPEGYGIYKVPYKTEPKNASSILIDELDMVYPLDPSPKLMEMSLNQDKTKLLLNTIENDKLVMTVIDLNTMTQTQQLELNDWDRDNNGWQMYDGGDFIVFYVQYHEITLLSVNENGDYEIEFIHEFDNDNPLYIDYISERSGASMDFDGEKLAIAKNLNTTNDNACTFYVAVFDKTGLISYGQYGNSLNTRGSFSYDDTCRPCDKDPIIIEWVK